MKKIEYESIVVHRGQPNLSFQENTLTGLHACLDDGFSVEVDAHFSNGELFLGHDFGDQAIKLSELDIPNVFVHMKTVQSPEFKYADCFYIENDPIVFTQRGKKWINVGEKLYESNAVQCSNELVGQTIDEINNIKMLSAGGMVCTKYASQLVNKLQHRGLI